MKVPQLDIKAQLATIHDEISEAVQNVVDSTQYINGPAVKELETAIAEYCGVKHAVGVSSGTDALLISLMALEVNHGDIVITTPYSFFATAGVVSRLGAKPMFADIDPDSYNIDPQKVRELIYGMSDEERRKVKALIPVHLYGQASDMTPLQEICAEYGIPIVEDGAQAIGVRYPSPTGVKKTGALGLVGCFSFFPSKNLGGLGDGGIVVTDDDDFVEQLRILRVHGAKPKYYHSFIGGNFRLDTIQAAPLLVKLKYLDQWHAGRQNVAAFYDEHLADIRQVKTPIISYQREYHIYNQYVISVERRDDLQEFLQEQNISTAIYYPVPFHLQPCFEYLGYKEGDFPISEHAANTTLALPVYPELSAEQQQFVVDTVRNFYRD
ncbi:DegT/DnrJ/EryC1/StrS family aminotransferase [Calditrichota bacterium]